MNAKKIIPVPIKYPSHADKNADRVDEVVKEAISYLCEDYEIEDKTQDMAVLFIVNFENDYHTFKKSFNKLAVLTQCVRK